MEANGSSRPKDGGRSSVAFSKHFFITCSSKHRRRHREEERTLGNVCMDGKLIKFGSSSSSVGRPSRLPPGLLLSENISSIQ